jgi:hypothetical protein
MRTLIGGTTTPSSLGGLRAFFSFLTGGGRTGAGAMLSDSLSGSTALVGGDIGSEADVVVFGLAPAGCGGGPSVLGVRGRVLDDELLDGRCVRTPGATAPVCDGLMRETRVVTGDVVSDRSSGECCGSDAGDRRDMVSRRERLVPCDVDSASEAARE